MLLLGSGEISRELAFAFHRLGVEVHAADRSADAPAQQAAHVSHVLDVTDPQAVTNLIVRIQPDYILPEIETIAADVLEAVDSHGVATVIPSAKAVALSTDRLSMRRLVAEELGLPTAPYRLISTPDELAPALAELGTPAIFKPADSSAIHTISTLDDAAFSGPGILERIIGVDLHIVLPVVRSTDPVTGKLATWFCEPIGFHHEDGEYVESWQPAYLSEAAMDSARSIAARVSNALGGRGVYNVKMFVRGDNVYFSGVHARPNEAGLVTRTSQRFSQFDLHARAVLDLPIDPTLVTPAAATAILSPFNAYSTTYSGVREALAVPESRVELFAKHNARVGRMMGVAIASAETVEEAQERSRAAASMIQLHADGAV